MHIVSETLGSKISTNQYKPLKYSVVIPDYQRIYCWSEKNVDQLLNDIIENGDNKYHLGSIILHKTNNDEYAIVDGQQRLVTLSLLLSIIQNDNIPIDLLNQEFYSTEAEEFVAFNKFLIKNTVEINKSKNKNFQIKNILKNLIFSVLIIRDEHLDLAYTFFSNQNSRGKSLTDYNLLKAHHLRFISEEKHAIHLATRWDNLQNNNNIESNEKNLNRTLGIYLFRLRKWMRNSIWNESEKFKVKTEFEAAPLIPDVPPFGEKFDFYESIQGGTHFFAFADHFIYRYETFCKTIEYGKLQNLNNESHWWYKDAIESLLFGYYLKFGKLYFSEALFCIERIISDHRYGTSRSSLAGVLKFAGDSNIIMMIDQATSPSFFLAESLQKINKLKLSGKLDGIRERYRNIIKTIYTDDISKSMSIEIIHNQLLNN
jgi:hypothetical protein